MIRTLLPSCFGEIQNCEYPDCIHSKECQEKTIKNMKEQMEEF